MNFFDTYREGWILHDAKQVGTFCSFTGEDCNGRRKISGVKFAGGNYNPAEFNNKALKFMWTEGYTVGGVAPSKIIEDFGFFVIVGFTTSISSIDCMKLSLEIAMCQDPEMKVVDNQKPQLLLSGIYGFNDTGGGRNPAICRLRALRARQLF